MLQVAWSAASCLKGCMCVCCDHLHLQVKLPITLEGAKAARRLINDGVPVTMTGGWAGFAVWMWLHKAIAQAASSP